MADDTVCFVSLLLQLINYLIDVLSISTRYNNPHSLSCKILCNASPNAGRGSSHYCHFAFHIFKYLSQNQFLIILMQDSKKSQIMPITNFCFLQNQYCLFIQYFRLTSIMIYRLRQLYHTRKPRILSEANKSFIEYSQRLREARRQVHIQAKQYQNKIEDQYLSKHQQQIQRKHFEHQCTFRKQVFTNAFRVHQNQVRWNLRDEGFTSRLNKHLHDEDVRKINRSRILKIMQHESNNYWFNEENVDTRLKQQTIFPQYIASTEYYYKLFAEALAYEFGDFQELHQLTSNEQILKEKNKLLIPLYLELRSKIVSYKRNEVKEEVQRHSFEVERLQSSKQLNQAQLKELIAKENLKSQQRIKQIQDKDVTPESKLTNLRKKIRDLVSIFQTWKQYTNIIGLTSAQVIKNQYDVKNEISINKAVKEVLSNLKARQTETFIGSIEEDTQEQEISFDQYLGRINKDRLQTQVAQSTSVSIEQLDNLLKSAEIPVANSAKEGNINLQEQKGLNFGDLLKADATGLGQSGQSVVLDVNPEFLNVKQTTSSVQILKEHFKKDEEFVQLLNQLGEIDVRYPKLFETVWQSIEG